MNKKSIFFIIVLLGLSAAACQLAVKYDLDKIPKEDSGNLLADSLTSADAANDTGEFDDEVESGANGVECGGADLWCNGVCVPNDAINCGICGHDCSSLAHLDGPVNCEQGACSVPVSSCASGWAHCSSNPQDGCETDISKPDNCGSCGNTCPAGAPLCVEKTDAATGKHGYECVLNCPPESPTQCGNTCVDTANSPANCGQCGTSCRAPNFATATCSNSICGFNCINTYLKCNGACIPNDEHNCGTCGTDCTGISHLACTQYLCAGNACTLQIANGYCFIDNTCYNNSANRPGNDCQYCDSAGKAQAWRDKNSGSCDDGNLCTTNDTCSSGVCSGATRNCDDGNACTTDTCNTGTGCVHTNNTASCSDGNACTTNDTCSGGVCAGGSAPNCDDSNVCTDDSCKSASGCVHTNNKSSCSDGNACTTNDTCSGGSCVGGSALNCDDSNACTTDSCNTGTGCVHTNNAASCATDNNVCTNDICAGGSCTHPNNTASCDDGNFCNGVDTCASGACLSSGNPCTGGLKGLNNLVCFPGPPGYCGCNNDGDCAATHYCNGSHNCTAKGGYNAACTAVIQCVSNICNSSLCGCATTSDCAGQNVGHVCRAGNACGCDAVGDCPNNTTCDTVTMHQCTPPK
jgi:hypothetical protein